jgi:glycosyltransferase involved in cell wall biosynthesis
MRILLVIHHELDLNAGAPGVVWQLGQQYLDRGHEVTYYSFDNIPEKVPSHLKRLLFPEFLAAYLCQNKFDVVDASTGDAWIFNKIQKYFPRQSPLLVTHCHGLEHIAHLANLEESARGNLSLSWKYPLYHGGFRLWEVASSLRSAELVFALNCQDAAYMAEHLNVSKERIKISPNGLTEKFLGLKVDLKLGSTESVVKIAQVGSYIERKGIRYSIPAIHRILSRFNHVQVSFIGTNCPASAIYSDFDPKFHDRLTIIPQYSHEELPRLLLGHQIKLFPTLSEGFSLALIEAMACGLAPVSTATPGAMEILIDQDNAYIIPERDISAIEHALEKLITDHQYLGNIRINAYNTVQKYSWKEIADQRLSLYQLARLAKEELS